MNPISLDQNLEWQLLSGRRFPDIAFAAGVSAIVLANHGVSVAASFSLAMAALLLGFVYALVARRIVLGLLISLLGIAAVANAIPLSVVALGIAISQFLARHGDLRSSTLVLVAAISSSPAIRGLAHFVAGGLDLDLFSIDPMLWAGVGLLLVPLTWRGRAGVILGGSVLLLSTLLGNWSWVPNVVGSLIIGFSFVWDKSCGNDRAKLPFSGILASYVLFSLTSWSETPPIFDAPEFVDGYTTAPSVAQLFDDSSLAARVTLRGSTSDSEGAEVQKFRIYPAPVTKRQDAVRVLDSISKGDLGVIFAEHTDAYLVASNMETASVGINTDLLVPWDNADFARNLQVFGFLQYPRNLLVNRGASLIPRSPFSKILLMGVGWHTEVPIEPDLWLGDYKVNDRDYRRMVPLVVAAPFGAGSLVVVADNSVVIDRNIVAYPHGLSWLVSLVSLVPSFLFEMVLIVTVIAAAVAHFLKFGRLGREQVNEFRGAVVRQGLVVAFGVLVTLSFSWNLSDHVRLLVPTMDYGSDVDRRVEGVLGLLRASAESVVPVEASVVHAFSKRQGEVQFVYGTSKAVAHWLGVDSFEGCIRVGSLVVDDFWVHDGEVCSDRRLLVPENASFSEGEYALGAQFVGGAHDGEIVILDRGFFASPRVLKNIDVLMGRLVQHQPGRSAPKPRSQNSNP